MTLDDVMELSQMRDQTVSWWLLHDAVKQFAAEQVAAEREWMINKVRPIGSRGCNCERCDCGNPDDAVHVALWDRDTEYYAAIRARAQEQQT